MNEIRKAQRVFEPHVLSDGAPLNEPIARYGPFIMNTQTEIEQTLRDLQNGTFVR
jgi:quercetin 2,3-dioxygenase